MAKKLKQKKDQTVLALSRRGKEKVRQLCRSFDKSVLYFILLVLLASGAAFGHPYELGHADRYGFLYWFLLIPAYLPLELLSGFSWLCHWDLQWIKGHEVWLLGGCDLLLAVFFWIWIRLVEARRRGPQFIHAAHRAVQLFIFWGIFQIACFVLLTLWQHGGFSPLHRHLADSNPSVAAAGK